MAPLLMTMKFTALLPIGCARGKPQYIDEILNGASDGEQVLLPGETAETDEEYDPLYDETVAFVTETRRGSISSVQRKFKIGYNRAARIIEQMEAQGIVSAGSKATTVTVRS